MHGSWVESTYGRELQALPAKHRLAFPFLFSGGLIAVADETPAQIRHLYKKVKISGEMSSIYSKEYTGW